MVVLGEVVGDVERERERERGCSQHSTSSMKEGLVGLDYHIACHQGAAVGEK
jgi:hypothetical protein